ncbi:PHP domain-containing protein [Glycomyces terrestris]|uniref:PHP domain-containing protein n=1 Tax=Glycomyces terrestris TaxID=2493553 RepID=A0A426V2X3_9ACTN|nr:PHP domain-containing protein [Glycomyces terrestris]RRS01207.1 PHP domain-containing protein [Glycomyces terrestris]
MTELEPAPAGTDRRGFLRGAGLVGAGLAGAAAAAATAAPAAAHDRERRGGYLWLAGDHHLHSQYSNDAMYRIDDQAVRAIAGGLDWIAITDHGNQPFAAHSIAPQREDLLAARERHGENLLIFSGLEWNIPAGEHTTLMMAPGDHEAEVLQEFVNAYDANVVGARDGTPANEALAVEALAHLGDAVADGRLADALVLPNHPARKGIDSPAELRAWQDAAPGIVIGFEGAPGHQAAGLPAPGMARGRGLYDSSPGRHSFPGYPAESYRTWGGFDWMTATVGGVWDSLLSEGRKWWITTTSDGHQACGDWVKNPVDPLDQTGYDTIPYNEDGDTFDSTGVYPPPVGTGRPVAEYSSFPPGAYNKTWVGASDFTHRAVMKAMRAGRMWVCFGDLVAGLDTRLRVKGRRGSRHEAVLGGTLAVRAGTEVELSVKIDLADRVNHAGLLPRLARVDVIAGKVTGPAADPNTLYAPETRVVESWDVAGETGSIELVHTFTVEAGMYVRVRGTDGKRSQPGYLGADVDPAGPALDVPGEVDPWEDLWFYTNPIFAELK